MPRILPLLLTLATLSAGAYAQTDSAGPPNTIPNHAQPAPIVRNGPTATWPSVTTTQPMPGVWLQTDANSTVNTVSATANGTEIRIVRGRANLQVHHPAEHASILVDLPGGQTTLLKDGLYTFNAETNAVRVLRGEAETTASAPNSKPVKIKENHELVLASGNLKAQEVGPREMAADLLPGGRPAEGYGPGYGYYGPYGDGYYPYAYPYPYYAYGWRYPYGFGLGFGYYGGYYGGFRGGFRGRFR